MAKIVSKAFLLNISTILPNGADESTAFPDEIRDLLEHTLLTVVNEFSAKYVVELESIEE